MECNDGIHKGLYDMGMVTSEICNEDIGSVVYSLILDYQFCACVMRISGVPQLQVIHMEHLYDYKWHVRYDRCVYHCFTDDRIWASLGRACVS